MRPLVLGTRGSPLALKQAQIVMDAMLAAEPSIEIRALVIRTEGDRRQDVSLDAIGGQGVFVSEIEHHLESGEIDLAVHSLKDMPAETPIGYRIAAFLPRADVRDALVAREGLSLKDLPSGATIGTDSRRRVIQLLSTRPDLQPTSVRGNVDTRIRKVDEGELHAVVLALAGLDRLGIAARATQVFEPDEMLPAVGQGVLAIEVRAEDIELQNQLSAIDDYDTRIAATAERAFLRRLGAGCRLPVGAYATVASAEICLEGMLDSDEGAVLRDAVVGPPDAAVELGYELADRLVARSLGGK